LCFATYGVCTQLLAARCTVIDLWSMHLAIMVLTKWHYEVCISHEPLTFGYPPGEKNKVLVLESSTLITEAYTK
jgi:hypothetical protein